MVRLEISDSSGHDVPMTTNLLMNTANESFDGDWLTATSTSHLNSNKNEEIVEFEVPSIAPVLKNSSILFITTAVQLITDTIITSFVAHLGADYAAVRGIAGTVIGFSFFLFGFLVDGTCAQVSHSLGIKNTEVLGGTIKLSILAGILAGFLTLLLFGPAYQLWLMPFDRSDLNQYVIPYFFVRLAGMPFNLVYNALSGILQGLHRVDVILGINLCIAGIDIFTNYAFIFWLKWNIVGE